jgi:ABC-2 type transport system ATP-binding protein
MADIQELCQRVIIIDHGKIFFDGKLDDVIDRFANFKIITIACESGANCSSEKLQKYGEVIEQTPAHIKLKVVRDA